MGVFTEKSHTTLSSPLVCTIPYLIFDDNWNCLWGLLALVSSHQRNVRTIKIYCVSLSLLCMLVIMCPQKN